MKYIAGGIVLVLLLAVVGTIGYRLLRPLAGEDPAPKTVNTPEKPGPPPLPPLKDLPTAEPDTKERARTVVNDAGQFYAEGFTATTVDGKPAYVVEVRYQPARTPETFWLGVSKQHSRVETSAGNLLPAKIEGSAQDLDQAFAGWVAKKVNAYSLDQHLSAEAGAGRLSAESAYKFKVICWAPEGYQPKPDDWAKVHVVGMTNRSIPPGGKSGLGLKGDRGVMGYPHLEFELYVPPKAQG